MSANVKILLGVAGSGKTARLLDEYCEQLKLAIEQQDLGTTLWITPTHWSRRLLLTTILDRSLDACFLPNILTFDQFADKILLTLDDPITLIPEAAKRTLIRRIIDNLQQQGSISHFLPIIETPGFLDLVMDFISELKRDEVWPDQFLEACKVRGEQPKDLELARIYSAYQRQLQELSLYDAEGRFWSVRSALRQGVRGPFGRLSLVVIDGFTDFTRTQFEILALLAECADQLVISLSAESPLVRSDLFAKTSRVQSRIEAAMPDDVHITHLTADHCYPICPAVTHIANCLFSNPRTVSRSPDASGIEIISATGPVGEIEALAARIKELLVAGVSADEIIVSYRTIGDQIDLIHEVFSAAGIPHWCDSGVAVIRAPVLKALMVLVELELDDWRFEDLMTILGSNYFRPDWAEFEPGATARIVAAQLRRFKLYSGRSAILLGLERHISGPNNVEPMDTATAGGGVDKIDWQPIENAYALLRRLAAATDRLRMPCDFKTWFDVLFSLARELGIAPEPTAGENNNAQLDARDLRAWKVFEGIVYTTLQFEQLAFPVPRQFSLEELAHQLNDLLNSQRMRLEEAKPGSVRVLEMPHVRNLDVPFLFLAGLTETDVPRLRGDDCIYHESERKALNRNGMMLRDRLSQSQDEMLLFYGVVTRARQKLILSYPSVSANGQPLFPSPYVTAVQEIFESDAIHTTHGGGLDPVPDSSRIVSSADLRIVATAEVQEHRPGLFRAMCERKELAETAVNILASVNSNVHRFHTRGFTNFEGLVRDPRSIERLNERFGSSCEFSATQLELYASCPFRFFLSDILDIDPQATSDFNTDFRVRGIMVHKLLAQLHQQLIDEDDAQLTGDAIAARLRELVVQEYGRPVHESEFQKALKKVERQLLLQWAEAYGHQWVMYCEQFAEQWVGAPRPIYLETPFGNAPEERQVQSEVNFECIEFGPKSEPVRLRGRIDRIDVGSSENQTFYNIIDYKTGTPTSFNPQDVSTGKAIQLALYLIAAERLKIAGPDATPFQMGYWSIKESGFEPGLKQKGRRRGGQLEQAMVDSLESILDEMIPRLVRGMRAGTFAVYSQDPNCTRYCPYNTVCRVSQIRPLQEQLDKRVD